MNTIKPIRNDADHKAALKEIDSLWNAEPGSDGSDRLAVLAVLVDEYERKHHVIAPTDPCEEVKKQLCGLQGRYDELRDRLDTERLYHDETKGYRQHAEQERDAFKAVLKLCATHPVNPDTCGVCGLHLNECDVDLVLVDCENPSGPTEPACAGAKARALLNFK